MVPPELPDEDFDQDMEREAAAAAFNMTASLKLPPQSTLRRLLMCVFAGKCGELLAMQLPSLGRLLGLWNFWYITTRADSYEEGVEHGIGD